MTEAPLYHVGDTARPLSGRCTSTIDGVTTFVGISNATTVKLHLKPPRGTVVVREVVRGVAVGSWSVPWDAGASPFTVRGTYTAEVEVTGADGKIDTFGRGSFYVEDQIA